MALWTKVHKDGTEIKTGWICDECDGWNSRCTKYCPHCGIRIKNKLSIPTITSIDEFIEASDWTDWIDQLTDDVYNTYWSWCIKEGLKPQSKITFMRKILGKYPELKSSPYKSQRYFRRRD